MNLEAISAKTRPVLEAKNAAREIGIKESRRTIRSCSVAIRAIHRDDYDEARVHLAEAKKTLTSAQKSLADHPDIYYAGFLQDAEKEFAEGHTTLALVTDQPLPDPDDIGVGYAQYLSGLGEAMGELRRHILDIIRKGDLHRGERYLAAMDDVFYFLLSFDFPDAITPNLRRNTDLAKAVMEKTRGDLTTAIRQASLRETLERIEGRLESGSE
ncbi:MAG: haloacid dehalogenase [Actinobacteria bacterium]|nr:haloacid dehalogenase [Actinomycetota bacterium]